METFKRVTYTEYRVRARMSAHIILKCCVNLFTQKKGRERKKYSEFLKYGTQGAGHSD